MFGFGSSHKHTPIKYRGLIKITNQITPAYLHYWDCGYYQTLAFGIMVLCVEVAICQMVTLHQRTIVSIASVCLNPLF